MGKDSYQPKRRISFDEATQSTVERDDQLPRDEGQLQESSRLKVNVRQSGRKRQANDDLLASSLAETEPELFPSTEPENQLERPTTGKPRNVEPQAKMLQSPSGSSMVKRRKASNTYKIQCTNCSSTSHTLDQCLKATSGTIPGCPLCKARGHFLEDCETFPMKMRDPSALVRLLVWDRGNKPAWETKVPWFQYLYLYMSTFEFFGEDRTFVRSAPLPWTETYSRNIASKPEIRRLQKTDHSSLPSDPQTEDLAAAWKTFAKPGECIPSSKDLHIRVVRGGIHFSFPRDPDRSTFSFYDPDSSLIESKNFNVTIELPPDGVTLEHSKLTSDWEELASSLEEDPSDFLILHINIANGHETNVIGFGLPFHAANEVVHSWVNEGSPIEGIATLSEILRLKNLALLVRATAAEIIGITQKLMTCVGLTDYGYGDFQTWDKERYDKQVPDNRGPPFPPTVRFRDSNQRDTALTQVHVQDVWDYDQALQFIEPRTIYKGRHWRAVTRCLRGDYNKLKVKFAARESTRYRTVTWDAVHLSYGTTGYLKGVDVTDRIPLGLIKPQPRKEGHTFCPIQHSGYPGIEDELGRDSIQLQLSHDLNGEKKRVDAVNLLGAVQSTAEGDLSRRKQAFNLLLVGQGLWNSLQASIYLEFPPLDLFQGVPLEVQRSCIERVFADDRRRVRQYFSKLHFGFGFVSGPPGTGKSNLAAILAILMCFNDSIKHVYVSGGSNAATTNILNRIDTVAREVIDKLANSGFQIKNLMPVRGYSLRQEVDNCLDALTGVEFEEDTVWNPTHWRFELSLCWWTLRALGAKGVPPITPADNQQLWDLYQKLNPAHPDISCDFSDVSTFRKLVEVAQGQSTLKRNQKSTQRANLSKLMEMVLECASIVATTPAASKTGIYEAYNFGRARAVIFDEAATMFMSDGLMIFGNTPRPMIAIGDPKQLQPVLPTEIEMLHDSRDKHETYDRAEDGFPTNRFAKFARISWLTCFIHLGWPVFHLHIQHRMAEGLFDMAVNAVYVHMKPQFKYSPLCNLSNFPIAVQVEEYMKREYRIRPSVDGRIQPVLFHCANCPCCNFPQKATRFNPRQVDCIAKLVAKMIKDLSLEPTDFVVLTPYIANRGALRKRFLGDNDLEKIECSTFDRFHGREAQIVLVSLCVDRCTGPSFVANERSLNVALTRQRSSLLIFGDLAINDWVFREGQIAESTAEGSAHFDDTLFRGVFSELRHLGRTATLYGDPNIDLKEYCHRMESSSQFP
ncbi:hypothetical protein FHETE_5344 [Fusarium heterosporum]|uniref:Uncharacterized protein n=1 Tax=Fusarium heterosporum TaxID=42747 RepID=A0A8H5TDV2_FUSHE|nr:hypothetical protein FHETE_5344 [Fusarium heterosporum]